MLDVSDAVHAGSMSSASSKSDSKQRAETRSPRAKAPQILIYKERRFWRAMRRGGDILLALLLLIPALPIIGIACLAILLEDGAPTVFEQRRAGRFERTFIIYKLRTMRKEQCGDGPSPTSGADSRITNVGRFLRKTSIDELPQLFNVLLGDMSLIGPRPEMPVIINERYENWQHLRHLIPPGITCIWQATVRSSVPLDRPEATALDCDYISRACAGLDGEVLLRTAASVLLRRGAF
jgi:lipopolysaccharide/colanic/teichoic acid biosynthesis glycosyltransferase